MFGSTTQEALSAPMTLAMTAAMLGGTDLIARAEAAAAETLACGAAPAPRA
jgi:hypothetical protein